MVAWYCMPINSSGVWSATAGYMKITGEPHMQQKFKIVDYNAKRQSHIWQESGMLTCLLFWELYVP
jgi:hypothetical protein